MIKKIIIIVVICIVGIPLLFGVSYVSVQLIQYGVAAEVFDVAEQENRASEIVVMNYNVRCLSTDDFGNLSWFFRASLIVDQIREQAPDIICFQEVSEVHQKYLVKNLQGYNFVLTYRDDDILCESTPIYYRADRFDLIEEDSFWLSETPDVMSKDWGSACYRICSCVVLKDKQTSKTFQVYNTHLDHKSDEARTKGIDVVLSKINSHGGCPAILTGDMNDKEGSITYNKALEFFLDSKYIATDTMDSPTYNGFSKKSLGHDSPIDYCFVSQTGIIANSYKVLNYQVDGRYCSDHYALVVKLELV